VSPKDKDKDHKDEKPPQKGGGGAKPELSDEAKAKQAARAAEKKKGGDKGADAPKAKAPKPSGPKVPARLKENYYKEVVPRLMKERQYSTVMAVPRLQKIVINMGVGEATQNIKVLDAAVDDLAKIAGQKPAVRRSKKSIAAFRLRQGMPIAAQVTLRGDRMFEFVDRLVNVALPRVRDFRGVPTNSFDGRGNYTLGLKDQLIFPEVDYAKVEKLRGMNVTFVTTARTDEESRLLLQYLGMPFRHAQEGR
jgi:large subunit ribosomal protein L5